MRRPLQAVPKPTLKLWGVLRESNSLICEPQSHAAPFGLGHVTSGAVRRNRTRVTKVQASRSATELGRQTGAGNRNQTCVDCLPSNWTVTVLYQRSWEADLNCSLEGTNLRFFPLNYPSKLWSTVGESNTRRRVCNPPPKPLGQRYSLKLERPTVIETVPQPWQGCALPLH